MKKNVFGRKLKRDANERKALFKNLLTSLVLQERIVTSEAKAKAIRAAADKLVTKAKKGGVVAQRGLAPDVQHGAVEKLIAQIAPRFTNRQGGYTRIIKVGRRVADNSPEVVMEWVEKAEIVVASKDAKKQSKAKAETAKKTTKAVKTEVKATTAVAKETKTEPKKAKTSILKQLVTRQKKG